MRRLLFVLSSVLMSVVVLSGGVWSGPARGAAPPEEPVTTITLLHLNDVYSLEPVDQGKRGGLARVVTLRKRVMAESPNVLFLLGGDTLSPSPESITTKGQHMVDAWNEAGLDLAVLGNHEFDLGPDVLLERMRESKFQWLGANVVDVRTGKPFGSLARYVIRDVGGVKVGVLGLLLPDTARTSSPGKDVAFQDVCATAKQWVPLMRKQGARVIVGLTHLSMSEDQALARCERFDLILGGHEHSLLMSSAGGTPILKVTADARELARVTLHVGKQGGRLQHIDWEVLPVTDAVPEDTAFVQTLRERHGELLARLGQRVGGADVPLEAGSVATRTRETNLGSFLADAYREATGADVALVNGGSIRADTLLPPGPIAERDVLSIIPFRSPVVVIEVNGRVLRQALEHGVSRSAEDNEPGRFPQVSGLRFAFDVCLPAGSRVVDVTVQGAPLDPEKTYTLATNAFLAGGGDGYAMLKEARVRPPPGGKESPVAQDVLREALQTAKVLSPAVDGRVERRRAGTPERAAGVPVSCPAPARP